MSGEIEIMRQALKLLEANTLKDAPLDVQAAAYTLASQACAQELARQTMTVVAHNILNPRK